MLPILYLSQTLSSFTERWRRGYRLIISVLLAGGLASCESLDQYEITLNERTLYTPRDLFEDYYLPDVALSNCVTQAIETSEVDGQQYSQPCRAVEADATRRAATRWQ